MLMGLVCLVIGACGSEGGGGDDVPLVPQCDAVADAWCAYMASCGVVTDDTEGETSCRIHWFSECETSPFPDMQSGCLDAITTQQQDDPTCSVGIAPPLDCGEWLWEQ